jgi:hypothetical protein
MVIGTVVPVFREIPAASAVPQPSLTRREQELQIEEGHPQIEVASAEQEALRWRKSEDLQEKWKQQEQRKTRRNAAEDIAPEAVDESNMVLAETTQENAESPEEEPTGTLFDDRS